MKAEGVIAVLDAVKNNHVGLSNAEVLAILFILAELNEVRLSFEYDSGWAQRLGDDGKWNLPEIEEDSRGYKVSVSNISTSQPCKKFSEAVAACFTIFEELARQELDMRDDQGL